MMVRGGISGTKRFGAAFVAHVLCPVHSRRRQYFWRAQHLFPRYFAKSGLLVLLTFAPLILMIFWLLRVR